MPFEKDNTARDHLRGVVEQQLFQSKDSNFVVLKIRTEAKGELVSVTGPLEALSVGETVELHGSWHEHPRFGRGFTAKHYRPIPPTTEEGIIRFLGSGLIPGLGPSLAARIVKKFGKETLHIIATQSPRLRDVSGIGKKRAQQIAEAVRDRQQQAETLSFLHSVGIGPLTARKILKRYGEETSEQLQKNPYELARTVAGIGFRTADRIGLSVGIEKDDLRRIEAAVVHLLREATSDGHVFLEKDVLGRMIVSLDIDAGLLEEGLKRGTQSGSLWVEQTRVYLQTLYRAEERLAKNLAAFNVDRVLSEEERVALKRIESDYPELTEEQKQASRDSFTRQLIILTGGPGTGKTTAVRALVEVHQKAKHRVLLCAPTGRAAKRLTQSTAFEASTVHRLLEWNPSAASFTRTENNPVECDLLLVDETSMLDLLLADQLLAAVPKHATVVFVGDINQLPPVGAGDVLASIMATETVKTICLQRIFRQAEKSAIVRAAHAILSNRLPQNTPENTKGPADFFHIDTEGADSSKALLPKVLQRMEESYGLDLKTDVQVLTAVHKGKLGTEQLNAMLQPLINPSAKPYKPARIQTHDKILQLRNDYEHNIFNGDIGKVLSVKPDSYELRFDQGDLSLPRRNSDDLALAYACTIHKAQGSEFPGVLIMIDPSFHIMLNRALIYTAITRATRLCVIVGPQIALKRAIANHKHQQRNSWLAERFVCARQQDSDKTKR
ncbi:MAG: ATP-dependent RecD-like DNA helicase [Myxococcales bacterium]|nr:MAG: ATP-dependent RecD-like DNA helicase [Myxococcales bacterium]